MAKAPRPWIVTPHRPIEKLEDNLWLVGSIVPGTPMWRRMAIVKRSDGTLAFFQAVPLDDAALAEVTAWGKPSILVVPHDQHGLDATPFAEKLGLKIYGPKANEPKLRAKFRLAGTLDDIPADPAVTFESVAGAKSGEAMATVQSAGGRVSLIFADAYMATPSAGLAFPMRVLGFGGGPKVTPIFKLLFLKDRGALKAHFERLAALPGLTHLIPCHGEVEFEGRARNAQARRCDPLIQWPDTQTLARCAASRSRLCVQPTLAPRVASSASKK